MQIENIPIEISKQFCKECRGTMLRVNDLLTELGSEIAPEQCFHQIFQEIDSLYRAAVSNDCLEIEYFSRYFAKLVEYLEQRLPDPPTHEYKTLLMEAIQLGMRCNGDSQKCLSYYSKDVIKIQDLIEQNCLFSNQYIPTM